MTSGPAAAPSGALYLGTLHERANVLEVDMGGTSFDVSLIRDGVIPRTTEAWIGEERVAIKMVDVSTIGAGGGSIGWIDALGLLRIGPQSAGAIPGPAAYGVGEEATVTDADVALGFVPTDYSSAGTWRSMLTERSLPSAGWASRSGWIPSRPQRPCTRRRPR